MPRVPAFTPLLWIVLLTAIGLTPTYADQLRSETDTQKTECPPLRLLLGQDKSESSPAFRTEQVTVADVEVLVGILRNACGGGELAVTIIREVSPRPLLRLRIPAPPVAPLPPPKHPNVFRERINRQQYELKTAEYEVSRTAWQSKVDSGVDKFLEQVTPLLGQTADGPRTDLLTALTRSATYFQELPGDPDIRPRQYLILLSDCEDNVNAKLRPIPADVRVLVVNGLGHVGVLPTLGINAIVFEAFQPAARFIATQQGR